MEFRSYNEPGNEDDCKEPHTPQPAFGQAQHCPLVLSRPRGASSITPNRKNEITAERQ